MIGCNPVPGFCNEPSVAVATHTPLSRKNWPPRGGGNSDGDDNFFRDLKAWLQARSQGSPDKDGGHDKGKGGKAGKGKGKQAVARTPTGSNARDDQVLSGLSFASCSELRRQAAA